MSNISIGDQVLITCDGWFYAPDGEQYRAVFGTMKGVKDAESVLGISTNSRSTNWYVEIGNMIVAGCQVYYAIKTDSVSFQPPTTEIEFEGRNIKDCLHRTRIYNADS